MGGRELAEEIRIEVERRVEAGEVVVLDLENVIAVTPSFADELFGKLPPAIGERVQFENVSDHLRAVAEMARAGRPDRANGDA